MDNAELTNPFHALETIGKNQQLRAAFVALCHETERVLDYRAGSIRDDITGPVLDALHNDAGILRKTLQDGTIFDFYYRSKIARDFVMSNPESPDHVWEPQTTKLLLFLAERAKQVLIGGAYFGDQAILIAKKIRAQGGVCHAFEPNPEQLGMLRHNAELNGLSNIKGMRLGLWDDNSTTLELVGFDSFATPKISDSAGAEDQVFNTITVDHYLESQGIAKIDLIMLDIEGGEYRVLKGARGQLQLPADQAPVIVFEVHRSYVDWSNGLQNTEIVQYLNSFGYRSYAVRDFNSNVNMQGKPIELIPPADVYLDGPPHGFNMLAIKDETILKQGPFKICHGVSPKLLLHKDPALHHPTDGLA